MRPILGRGLSLAALPVLLLGISACSRNEFGVELIFPDTESLEVTRQVAITALEPFAAGGESGRRLVTCGDIGVFPPKVLFNRDGSDIPGLPALLANSIDHDLPDPGSPWTLEITAPISGPDSNPWEAVLVHIEAQTTAKTFEPGVGLMGEDTKTILEGCFCTRFNETTDVPDNPLNADVLEHCPPNSDFEETVRQIQMKPVVEPPFELAPCGVTDLAAPTNQELVAEPGFCVRELRCSPNDTSGACFECADPSCNELNDKRNAPIHVTIVEDSVAGVEVTSPVILSDKTGRVVPVVRITDECSGSFTVRGSIIGRPTDQVDFNVVCVPSINFPQQGSRGAPFDFDLDETPVRMATVPGARTSGGYDAPMVAVISQVKHSGEEPDDARLHLLSFSSGFPRVETSTTFVAETARGVFGYYYDRRMEGAYDQPVIAVATSAKAPGREHEETRIRLLQYDRLGGTLRTVRTMSGFCSQCTCAHEPFCEACSVPPSEDITCSSHADCDKERACEGGACDCVNGHCRAKECFSGYTQPTLVGMSADDLDGDGFAELAIAPNTDFIMTTFHSAPNHPEHHAVRGEPLQLPPLEKVCKCAGMGKVLKSFDFIELGGINAKPTVRAIDLLMGDPTGAFVRYSSDERVDGLPCESDNDCGDLSCVDLCDGRNQKRCVERCDGSAPTCTDPLRSQCVDLDPQCDTEADCEEGWACVDVSPLGIKSCRPTCTTMTESTDCQDGTTCEANPTNPNQMVCSGRTFCAGPILGCRQPNSVWKLTGVSDVARSNVNGGPYEDAICVAQGSPVPGNLETGKVRILFGSEDDLTDLDNAAQEVRDKAIVDITPARLQGQPQGARSVQVGDFNGDGFEDFGVLFATSEEIRVWLGGGVSAPGEITRALDAGEDDPTKELRLSDTDDRSCFPLDDFVAADLDNDGLAEVVVVCNTNPEELGASTLRLYEIEVE